MYNIVRRVDSLPHYQSNKTDGDVPGGDYLIPLPKKMYQTGYQRRSFRAPNNKRYLLVNQINFLRSLVVKPHLYNYQKNVYFDLTLEEQIRYDNTLSLSTNQFMLWSAALDLGDTALFELFEAIEWPERDIHL